MSSGTMIDVDNAAVGPLRASGLHHRLLDKDKVDDCWPSCFVSGHHAYTEQLFHLDHFVSPAVVWDRGVNSKLR